MRPSRESSSKRASKRVSLRVKRTVSLPVKVLVVGDAGCGKTSTVKTIAEKQIQRNLASETLIQSATFQNKFSFPNSDDDSYNAFEPVVDEVDFDVEVPNDFPESPPVIPLRKSAASSVHTISTSAGPGKKTPELHEEIQSSMKSRLISTGGSAEGDATTCSQPSKPILRKVRDSVASVRHFFLKKNNAELEPSCCVAVRLSNSPSTNGAKLGEESDDQEKSSETEKEFTEKQTEREDVPIVWWDLGGQIVFHSLHHLFMSNSCIYMVVFNLMDFETHDFTKRIEHWLDIIKLYALESKVLLVGTHMDRITKFDDYVERVNDHLFDTLKAESQAQLVLSDTDSHCFFPIGNIGSSPEKVDAIRQVLQETKRTFTSEEFDQTDTPRGAILAALRGILKDQNKILFPTSWLSCLNAMTSLQVPFLELSSRELQVIFDENTIFGDEKGQMLDAMHNQGLLIFLNKSDILQSRVVLDPQWLIDQLTKIIRSKEDQVPRNEIAELRKWKLAKEFNILMSSGIASTKLLRHFFLPVDFDW